MDSLIWLWLILIGILAGTTGSLAGLGGGIVIVPTLLLFSESTSLFTGLTPAQAVGTSLFLIIFTAFASTLSYAKQKKIDFRSGWIFFGGCGPGAVIGAYLSRFLELNLFYFLFGLLMAVVASMLLFKDRLPQMQWIQWDVKRTFQDGIGNTYTFGYHRLIAFFLALWIGLISGLFGVGGGALFVPFMIILFHFPPHIATATSMFTIFLTSIVGSITHVWQGNVDWFAILCLAPGAWLGGKWGAWIAQRLDSQTLLNILRLIFILVAFRMIMKGLHVF